MRSSGGCLYPGCMVRLCHHAWTLQIAVQLGSVCMCRIYGQGLGGRKWRFGRCHAGWWAGGIKPFIRLYLNFCSLLWLQALSDISGKQLLGDSLTLDSLGVIGGQLLSLDVVVRRCDGSLFISILFVWLCL